MRNLSTNPETIFSRNWQRQRYHSDPQYRAKVLKAARDWRKANPESSRRSSRAKKLRRNFGLTIEDYEKMLAKQGGVCAICKKPPGKIRLAVDHDHKTKQNRGLLCHPCNQWLGYIENNLGLFFNTFLYIRSYGEWS